MVNLIIIELLPVVKDLPMNSDLLGLISSLMPKIKVETVLFTSYLEIIVPNSHPDSDEDFNLWLKVLAEFSEKLI